MVGLKVCDFIKNSFFIEHLWWLLLKRSYWTPHPWFCIFMNVYEIFWMFMKLGFLKSHWFHIFLVSKDGLLGILFEAKTKVFSVELYWKCLLHLLPRRNLVNNKKTIKKWRSYLSNLSITSLFAPLDVHYNNILNSDVQKQYQI